MAFKDILGQAEAIKSLKALLNSARIPQGLLFCGQEAIGKRLTARVFAKALNCLKLKDDSCDECVSCKKIDAHNHPDVRFIFIDKEQAQNMKIEQIRQLQAQANLKAFEARKKVFIIDSAERMTEETANAFLKILEEPPQDTIFILISAQPNFLLPTIVSRCQKIRFSQMPKERLKQVLINNYALEKNLSHFLAYFSEGRIGQALRLKDHDILNQKNTIIDNFFAKSEFDPDLFDLEDKEVLKQSLEIILTWVRDIYLLKAGLAHGELINFDRRNEILSTMPKLSILDLEVALGLLSEAALYLEQNINPKLILANVRLRLWTKLHR